MLIGIDALLQSSDRSERLESRSDVARRKKLFKRLKLGLGLARPYQRKRIGGDDERWELIRRELDEEAGQRGGHEFGILTVMRSKKVKKIGPSRIDRTFKAGVYLQDSEFMTAALAGVPVHAPLASVEDAFQTQRLACDLLNASTESGTG